MWTKFGQMAGKTISNIKKPKGIKAKAMSMAQNAKSKAKEYGSKIAAHVKRNPLKYTAGVSAYAGYDFANIKSEQEKLLKKHFKKLPKSDPRYKSLKKMENNS
ncbi:MAG: hypothetical protein O3A39_06745 [Proteobacteria bacterium]|nr:hypothetical protein [Pseudomonadota bacterium]